jgi:hypothetical protein
VPGSPYQLVLLADPGSWRDEVLVAIQNACAQVLLRPDAVTVENLLPPASDPATDREHTVVVLLADEVDEAVAVQQVVEAGSRSIAVLPVLRARTAAHELPEPVNRLNAMRWDDDPSAVTRAILRLFGLIEHDRKLFLSYRQRETSALALQLRRELTDRAYDVFLDRFSVPPAADFQRRLDIELADKAFVVVLESAEAAGSEWVAHEIAYALGHGITVLALTLPETATDQCFPTIDNAFRIRLSDGDLTGQPGDADRRLTSAALRRILDEIEWRYASLMRRRREQLLGSLRDWLRLAGHREVTEEGWALIAADPNGVETAYLITPRAPVPGDVREVDRVREAREDGLVVFAAPAQDPDDAALIEWICEGRPLGAAGHMTIPERLGFT